MGAHSYSKGSATSGSEEATKYKKRNSKFIFFSKNFIMVPPLKKSVVRTRTAIYLHDYKSRIALFYQLSYELKLL